MTTPPPFKQPEAMNPVQNLERSETLLPPETRLAGLFLSEFLHRLRNPMGTLQGFAELMAQGVYGPVSPRQEERLRSMRLRSREVLTLVQDAVDLARATLGVLECDTTQIDPDHLLRQVLKAFQTSEMGTDHSVNLQTTAPIPRIKADADRLSAVLVRLLCVVARRGSSHLFLTVSNRLEGALDFLVRPDSDSASSEAVEPFEQRLPVHFDPANRLELDLYLASNLAQSLGGEIREGCEARQGFILRLIERQGLEETGQ